MRLRIASLFLLLMSIALPSWSADQTAEFKKQKQEGSLIYYSGTVILEGEFTYSKSREDQEMIGDQVCFYPAKKYGKFIPRENDRRIPWFCFKDSKQAKDLLSISDTLKNPEVCRISGVAKVEISNYIVDKAETDTNDKADLIKVINKEKPMIKSFSKSGQECK